MRVSVQVYRSRVASPGRPAAGQSHPTPRGIYKKYTSALYIGRDLDPRNLL